MPRHRRLIAAVLTSLALTVGGPAVSPAQAKWTGTGDLTHYRICRTTTPSGQGWQFISRVSKRHGEQARAGVTLYRDGKRHGRWRSGWLHGDQVARGVVRIKRSGRVRVHVWEEAGDPDSPIGTAASATSYRPMQIRSC